MPFQISLFIISIICFTLVSCKSNKDMKYMEKAKLYQENIQYPYKASKKREGIIRNNMNNLKKGMSAEQVIEKLTKPDEVNLTRKSIKKADGIIGFSFVYLLRRDQNVGSVNEKNEQLIRVHFDKFGKLIWSYAVKIQDFIEIEK